MLYINQKDYPNKPYHTRAGSTVPEEIELGKNTTVSSSGCGLCASVMVADRLLYDYKFDLDDAIQLSYDCVANHRRGTDFHIYAPRFAEKMGLRLEMTSDVELLLHCLRTGGCVIAQSGGDQEGYIGVFTHGGHYITVISVMEDGRLCILDPSQVPGKFDEPGRVGKVETDGHFCYCTPDVLAKDCASKSPSFYLFWRK